MGGDDRARVRGRARRSGCGRSSSSGSRPLREPRASVAAAPDGPGPDRCATTRRGRPSWRAATTRSRVPGAWQRLLPAIADDVAQPALLTPAELRGITAPTLVACGDRDPFVPGRPGRRARAAGPRRAAARRARQRPRRPQPAAGAGQRGAARLLSFDRAGRRGISRPPHRRRPDDHAARAVPPTRRRPGGPGDVRAALRRRSTCRSSPGRPGLRETRVQRVVEALGGETDLILVTAMRFDDRAALDAGLALRCDARRRPEPARDRARAGDPARARGRARNGRGGFPGAWILSERQSRSAVTDDRAAATSQRAARRDDRRPLVRVAFPAPAPRPRRRPTICAGVALVTLDRPRGAQRAELRPARRAGRRARGARCATRPAGRSSSPAPGDRAFAAGADIRELAPQTIASLDRRRPVRRAGTGSPRSACRSSPRSAASPSAVAASWRWPAT